MNIHSIPAFDKYYIMQHGDIRRFATTLADGFSEYNMSSTFATEFTTMA